MTGVNRTQNAPLNRPHTFQTQHSDAPLPSPRASRIAPQNSPRAFPRAGVFVFVCEKTRPPPVSGDGQVELYSMNVACLARQQETALPVAMDSLQARTNSSVRTASA